MFVKDTLTNGFFKLCMSDNSKQPLCVAGFFCWPIGTPSMAARDDLVVIVQGCAESNGHKGQLLTLQFHCYF